MPVLALLLLVAWLGLATGVPIATRLRAGRAIPRRHPAPRGSAGWWARIAAGVGILLAVTGPLAALAGLGAFPPLDRPGVRLVAIGLVVIGISVTLLAQAAMGDSWRADVDPDARTMLVTNGPFAVVRNPILAAGMVVQLGLALLVPNVLAAAMLVAFQVAVQLQVRRVEEPYLLRVHGEAYRAYAARTGRFIPGLGRLHA